MGKREERGKGAVCSVRGEWRPQEEGVRREAAGLGRSGALDDGAAERWRQHEARGPEAAGPTRGTLSWG